MAARRLTCYDIWNSLQRARNRRIVVIGSRIGIGHDTHRLAPVGPLRLGGIKIPHDAHLVGHSDADVVLHAVTDALLGAVAAGDIGDLFPDTASENLGRDSAEMLRHAYQLVCRAGYHLVNLDCIVFAQRPKLSAFKQQIRQRIADILDTTPEFVSLKAKTGEHVGPVGREEVIAVQCIVLVDTKPIGER
ncbi:MAG: 2-C-methyl-D-erythritol 2,4-cyclodiphosphate synthase [Pirellulaceae bacterium]